MFKNELKIYRGESFTIDRILKTRDGTPYIISSELKNPHFLISISNTQYSQEERYVKNYWLSLKNFPRFELTQAFNLSDIKTSADGTESKYNKFSDVTEFPLEGYLNGQYVIIYDNYAVFTDGNEYKYWRESDERWIDYECRLVKAFTSQDTKEFIAQNYLYSIQLVFGTNTRDYLLSLANIYLPQMDLSEASNKELYDALKEVIDFPKNFQYDQALAVFNSVPILAPTTIKVIDYTQGDVTW